MNWTLCRSWICSWYSRCPEWTLSGRLLVFRASLAIDPPFHQWRQGTNVWFNLSPMFRPYGKTIDKLKFLESNGPFYIAIHPVRTPNSSIAFHALPYRSNIRICWRCTSFGSKHLVGPWPLFMPDPILSHFILRPQMSNKARLSISTFLSSFATPAAADSLVNKDKKS